MFLIWNLGLSAVVWLAAQGGGTPYDVQTDLVVQERYGVQDPFGVIEETLLGSSDTHVYHHPWCSLASKTKPGKYAMFNTVQHAKKEGYKPCDICRPPSRLGY